MAVYGLSVSNVVLADLEIEGPDVTARNAGGDGYSSYGIYARSSTMTITRARILAGNGADALNGSAGSDFGGTAPGGGGGDDEDDGGPGAGSIDRSVNLGGGGIDREVDL
jgi:hypothetical protein